MRTRGDSGAPRPPRDRGAGPASAGARTRGPHPGARASPPPRTQRRPPAGAPAACRAARRSARPIAARASTPRGSPPPGSRTPPARRGHHRAGGRLRHEDRPHLRMPPEPREHLAVPLHALRPARLGDLADRHRQRAVRVRDREAAPAPRLGGTSTAARQCEAWLSPIRAIVRSARLAGARTRRRSAGRRARRACTGRWTSRGPRSASGRPRSGAAVLAAPSRVAGGSAEARRRSPRMRVLSSRASATSSAPHSGR